MYKVTVSVRLRVGKANEPVTDNWVMPDQPLDVLDDDGSGWVRVRAYYSHRPPAEGFVHKTWIKLDDNKDIDKVKFIQQCFFAGWDFDVVPPYLIAVAQIESGIRNIPSSSSAAFGPFQIMPDTWSRYMVDPKIGLSEGHRYDPYRQPMVAAKIAAEAISVLAAVLPGNRNPTPPELYCAHFFGVGAAKIILQPLNQVLPIDRALLKVYTGADAQAKVDKIISANKSRLAPAGQPLLVDTLLINIGESLKKALAASVPPDIARAVADPFASEVAVAMAVSDSTRYWIVNLSNEEIGGQALVRQVGDEDPEVVKIDSVLLPIEPGLVSAEIAIQLNKSAEQGNAQQGPPGHQPPAGADLSAIVLAKAKQLNRSLQTGTVPNTQNGELACAWAVNEVVRQAIGSPIGGDLSTDRLFEALQNPQNQHMQIQPNELTGGCIVISPTEGRTGHVGIVGDVAANLDDTKIYSNSSSKKLFCDNYTIGSWKKYFTGLGLRVLFFRL